MYRTTGVLLSISSLPSKYGIGCFDQTAFDFIDWLAKAGQTFWQILPLTTTSYGEAADSPYKSFSAFAGNPYFISLEWLVGDGFLTKEDLDAADLESLLPGDVDYEKMHTERFRLLRKAYTNSRIYKSDEFHAFCAENAWWLDDYALFMSLKNFFGYDNTWLAWPEDIRRHWPHAVSYYQTMLYYDVEFQKFMQFEFYKQWAILKGYANKRHIQIVGDIPIYVSPDSADVWAHEELFQLDEKGFPQNIAGCPPDAFSATGQIWGNPLYRWDYHRSTDYSWWTSRMWNCFRLYDVVRIDHFRGFDEYFAIPSNAESALEGHWEKGPNMDLFRRLEAHLGRHLVLAEDLGLMTDSVRLMVKESGFPNMKVLQFAFEKDDLGAANDYLPHNYGYNCVAYTGTHDNDTILGWFGSLTADEQTHVRKYIGDMTTPVNEMNWPLISTVMRSTAFATIIPMQDLLGLGNEARMNKPATVDMNWRWRLVGGETTDTLAAKMKETARLYGRMNWDNEKTEKEK